MTDSDSKKEKHDENVNEEKTDELEDGDLEKVVGGEPTRPIPVLPPC